MAEIKNFVDNIHNESYKDGFSTPIIGVESLIVTGGGKEESLDGLWNFSVDMYDNCLRAKWFLEEKTNEEGRLVPLDYAFDDWDTVSVPGVFNLEKPEYFYYEGPAVYSRRFSYENRGEERVFLKFGAVAGEARVFLNGCFLGLHRGGSTPFSVEVTEWLKTGDDNRLIVVADNTRRLDAVPSLNTDWFPYGGIYRGVSLIRLPSVSIRGLKVWLSEREGREITVEAAASAPDVTALFEIPELGIEKSLEFSKEGKGRISFKAPELKLWEPDQPKLYDVVLTLYDKNRGAIDRVTDRIGFRTIETRGRSILLNGRPLFLRGVCLHEDSRDHGKAVTREEIREAFRLAKEMNCNFLRLAHYPHTEWAAELADEEGLLLWEEIPVYWWIDFANEDTKKQAKDQLTELMTRDANRASVIIWSVGNENPDTDERYRFMADLAEYAKAFDPTRLVSAACLVDTVHLRIEDRLEAHLDVIGLNEYYGWYDPDYKKLSLILENSAPEKPVIVSEFGADGAFEAEDGSDGSVCDSDRVRSFGSVRGSVKEQEEIYKNQIDLFREIPYIQGTTPWILFDFRTPKRLGKYQKGYNIKGLMTEDRSRKKPAFSLMQQFYKEVRENECRYSESINRKA